MTRVVVDTNVLISGTIAPRGTSAAILDAWRKGEIEAVTCPDILVEVNEKLRSPRIQTKYRIADDQISALILELGQAAMFVPGAALVDPATAGSERRNAVFHSNRIGCQLHRDRRCGTARTCVARTGSSCQPAQFLGARIDEG